MTETSIHFCITAREMDHLKFYCNEDFLFIQGFLELVRKIEKVVGGSKLDRSPNTKRNHAGDTALLHEGFFSNQSTYPEHVFKCRF